MARNGGYPERARSSGIPPIPRGPLSASPSPRQIVSARNLFTPAPISRSLSEGQALGNFVGRNHQSASRVNVKSSIMAGCTSPTKAPIGNSEGSKAFSIAWGAAEPAKLPGDPTDQQGVLKFGMSAGNGVVFNMENAADGGLGEGNERWRDNGLLSSEASENWDWEQQQQQSSSVDVSWIGQVRGGLAGSQLATPLPVIWQRVGIAAVVTVFFLCLGSMWELVPSQSGVQYAVVIDCGSTGSRAYVYAWTKHRNGSLPIMHQLRDVTPRASLGMPQSSGNAYRRVETEPGIDKFVGDRNGLRERALKPLIDWAVKEVPASRRAATPLLLFATAGMRKLPEADSAWILDGARTMLEDSPFLFRREWARIISGVDEAVYGWIALNYMLSRMSETHEFFTLGSLDLGGSSLEVTFVPTRSPRAGYGTNVTVQSTQYHLYAHSHAGYGLNDGFDRSVTLLLKRASNVEWLGKQPIVRHPCLHAGYNRTYARSKVLMRQARRLMEDTALTSGKSAEAAASQADVILMGAPDWDKCRSLATDVVGGGRKCQEPPCALGAHQPALRGQFYALTGFFVVYHFLQLPTDAPLEKVLESGRAFCAASWADVEKTKGAVRNVDRYCFRAPYIVSLLRDGLGLLDKQVTVGSGDMGWTLGAALYEAGALRNQDLQHPALVLTRPDGSIDPGLQPNPEASWPAVDHLPGSADDLMPYLVLLLIVVVIIVTTGVRWQQAQNARRRGFGSNPNLYGAAGGSLSWLRLPQVTGASGVRSVGDWEGRSKLSPLPERRLDMKNGLGRNSLDSLKASPDASPGMGGYPLGSKPANFVSRRTQSREDLMKASQRDFGRDRDRDRDSDNSN